MGDQNTEPIDVVAVGDIYLSRTYPKTAFDQVKEAFDTADLVLGNLESTLTTNENQKFLYPWASLTSTPEMAAGLDCFDALSLANNHGMDCGTEGLLETIEVVTAEGVEVVGAGENLESATRAATFSIGGTDISILAFEATQWSWPKMRATSDRAGMNVVPVSPFYPDPKVSEYGLEQYHDHIESVASETDILLVMLHSGIAGDHTIATHQRALAERAVEAGADAVLGAHPHILQPVRVYDGVPIVYSLSNFVFDSPSFDFPRETVMVRLEIEGASITGVELYPVYINESGQPTLPSPESESFDSVAELLTSLSERVGTTLQRNSDHLRVPVR